MGTLTPTLTLTTNPKAYPNPNQGAYLAVADQIKIAPDGFNNTYTLILTLTLTLALALTLTLTLNPKTRPNPKP